MDYIGSGNGLLFDSCRLLNVEVADIMHVEFIGMY